MISTHTIPMTTHVLKPQRVARALQMLLLFATLVAVPSLLAQAALPSFRQHPASQELEPGRVAVFHVEVDGEYSQLQWRRDGAALDGEHGTSLYLATDEVVSTGFALGVIDCVATALSGIEVVSNPAALTSSEGSFGPFPVANRTCLGCPPPFVGGWEDVNQGVSRSILFGNADACACDFEIVRGASAPNLKDEVLFTTRGYLGDDDRSVGGVSAQRDGVGLPFWMYGWFDFTTLLVVRPACVVEIWSDDSLVATGVCDVTHRVGCAEPPTSFKKGYEYYLAKSDLSQAVSWGVSQQFTYEGQLYPGNRLVFRPTESQRLLLPAVQKRTVSSLTIENRSAASTTVNLKSCYSDLSFFSSRYNGWDVKANKKVRMANPNSTGTHFDLGPLEEDGEWAQALTLGHVKNPVGPPTAPLDYSWGVTQQPVGGGGGAGSGRYRSVDCSGGLCSFTDLALELAPASAPSSAGPECILGMQAEALVSGGPGGGPHVKRQVADLQWVDQDGDGEPEALTCDYSGLGITEYMYVLKLQGNIVGQGFSFNTQLSCPRPFRLRICIPKNGEDLGSIYINLPLSTFRLNGMPVLADHVEFVPLGTQNAQVFGVTSCAVGGMGHGKVSFQDFSLIRRCVAMDDAVLSIPPNDPNNDCDGFTLGNPLVSGFAVFGFDPVPVTTTLIVPTPLGHAINTKGAGANTRLLPIPINDPSIGFADPLVTLPQSITKQQDSASPLFFRGRQAVAPTRSGQPGTVKFACDLFDCDSWSLVMQGHNLDGSPPAGPTSLTLVAYGKTASIPAGGPPINGPIGSLTATQMDAASEVVLTPDFSAVGSPLHHLVLLYQGNVVFNEPHRMGEACSCSSWPNRWGKLGGQTECFAASLRSGPLLVTPAHGMPPILCDQIQVLAEIDPASGHAVLAKTGVLCTFTGWSSAECDDADRFSGPLPAGTTALQPSAVQAVGNATVSMKEYVGHVTLIKQRTAASFHVVTTGAGQGTTIDIGGADVVKFNLRRSDYGTGPDCGVKSVFKAQFAKPDNGGVAPRVARVSLGRDVANRCVLAPNFTQFAAGEIQVYSWPFGTDDCLTGTASTNRGFAPVNGYSLTSPVWPEGITTACAPGAVFMGDIIIIIFPVPTEISFSGAPPVVVGAVGFVSRPQASLVPWPIQSCAVTAGEVSDFVLDDFEVHMLAPAHALFSLDASTRPNALEWSSRHAVLERCVDGSCFSWEESAAYEIVQKPDGKICHQARIVPPYSPTNPIPPKDFFRLRGRYKGWDATISGR